jgi:hypothetical protein
VLHEVASVVHAVAQYVTSTPSPTPQPTPNSNGSDLAGWAALLASVTGLVSAVGAIFIGLRKREGNSAAGDKAIEYLIKQNRDLLKAQPKDGKRP